MFYVLNKFNLCIRRASYHIFWVFRVIFFSFQITIVTQPLWFSTLFLGIEYPPYSRMTYNYKLFLRNCLFRKNTFQNFNWNFLKKTISKNCTLSFILLNYKERWNSQHMQAMSNWVVIIQNVIVYILLELHTYAISRCIQSKNNIFIQKKFWF